MKKTLSLFLAVVMLLSGTFCINLSVLADDCEHEYGFTYDYLQDEKQITITPTCKKCSVTDDANVIVISNISYTDGALTADINNPDNPYLTQLGFNDYIKEGRISVASTEALTFLNKISESISDEDKTAFANQLGVDPRVLTCKHANLMSPGNFNLQMSDTSSGVGTIKCPDCGLEYSIHFTVSNLDMDKQTATIYIQELDKSFDVDISFFIEFIQSQLGDLGGGTGGSGGGMGGLSAEQLAALMELLGQSGGGGMMGGGSGSSFEIPKSKILKIKSLKKSLKIKFKKVDYASGYQIKYSTSKKFTKKTTKKVNVKAGKQFKTIKKLKKKKKYYVKIRVYVSYNCKKMYSKWSKAKSQKTK